MTGVYEVNVVKKKRSGSVLMLFSEVSEVERSEEWGVGGGGGLEGFTVNVL